MKVHIDKTSVRPDAPAVSELHSAALSLDIYRPERAHGGHSLYGHIAWSRVCPNRAYPSILDRTVTAMPLHVSMSLLEFITRL